MKIFPDKKKLFSFQVLFFFITVLNSVPILLFSSYPSLDGPIHISNTNLLREILLYNNDTINQFFKLNSEIIPNWSSHFILFLLRFVFSSAVADKIFLLTIAFALPVTTYSLINRIAPQNKLLAVFSLPFVYTFLFGLGLYNFCLGVIVFLFTLNYWINRKNIFSLANILGLFGLITLSYFTHILIFILTFSSVGLYSLLKGLDAIKSNNGYKKSIKEIIIIVIVGLPTLLLAYQYFSIWKGPLNSTRFPINELFKWIFDVRSLIIHNYGAEVKFSRLLFLASFVLLLYSIIKYSFIKGIDRLPIKFDSPKFFFGILSIVFLILYFIYPDNSSGGSYITIRLNILFFLIFFIWLSTFKYPQYLIKICFVIILISTTGLSYRNYLKVAEYKDSVEYFKEAEAHIAENSVILPMRNSGRMLDLHFPHYLGWKKPVVILENFEATTMYYPLVWNLDNLPNVMLGDSIIMDGCLFEKFPATSINQVFIDYVVVWGTDEMNECKKGLWTIVNRDYNLIYSSENSMISLYKLKHTPPSQ